MPFDGEQEGNSAEILGGPAEAPLLHHEARHAVEQVMRFENDEIDNPRRALPLDRPLGLPQLIGVGLIRGHIAEATQALHRINLQLFHTGQIAAQIRLAENATNGRTDAAPAEEGMFTGAWRRVRELAGRPQVISAVRQTQTQTQAERDLTDEIEPLDHMEDPIAANAVLHARRIPTPETPQPSPKSESLPPHQVIDLTGDDDDDEVAATGRVTIDLTGEY